MNDSELTQSGTWNREDLIERAADLERLFTLVTTGRSAGVEPAQVRIAQHPVASLVGVLGAPAIGKSALLKAVCGRIFDECPEIVPVYHPVSCAPASDFARDFLTGFLGQFLAFRLGEPDLTRGLTPSPDGIARLAPPEDSFWIDALISSFGHAASAGDSRQQLRIALAAPRLAATRTGLRLFVALDDLHEMSDQIAVDAGALPAASRDEALRAVSELIRDSGGNSVVALSGLRRPLLEMLDQQPELLKRAFFYRVEPLGDEGLEEMVHWRAGQLGLEISDSTAELIVQQIGGNLFYVNALLDRAAASGRALRSFIDFERLYSDEVSEGRIARYLASRFRRAATTRGAERAALEAVNLVLEAPAPAALGSVLERMRRFHDQPERLLERMHALELVELTHGFVSRTPDSVLTDYARLRYGVEVAGSRVPVSGSSLVGDKLKESHALMMSRYNRSVEATLAGLIARFDFQSVPSSLLDQTRFDELYRSSSRLRIHRLLESEKDRLRLPQTVEASDFGPQERGAPTWKLLAAKGFEGGIYSDASEVLWLVALIGSRDPVDAEAAVRIRNKLLAFARASTGSAGRPSRAVTWYISKEGFTERARERLSSWKALFSTYEQLDLLNGFLEAAALDRTPPAAEFELVIPIEDDSELIAARTAEQIARTAEFSQEAINQIKTALIEACINASEHGDSPDRRIHQKFVIQDDRLTVTVTNRGRAFDHLAYAETGGDSVAAGKDRGRGLRIIRALMDEVRFERTDDGTSLVMTKYKPRPEVES